MTYNHAHPDSDLFNEKTREITLAEYVKKVTTYKCVTEKQNGFYKSSANGISGDSSGNHMDD